jgi:hypothetical protein
VDKLELRQKVEKWFANVKDSDFTSCTDGKPFFRYFNSHFYLLKNFLDWYA